MTADDLPRDVFRQVLALLVDSYRPPSRTSAFGEDEDEDEEQISYALKRWKRPAWISAGRDLAGCSGRQQRARARRKRVGEGVRAPEPFRPRARLDQESEAEQARQEKVSLKREGLEEGVREEGAVAQAQGQRPRRT